MNFSTSSSGGPRIICLYDGTLKNGDTLTFKRHLPRVQGDVDIWRPKMSLFYIWESWDLGEIGNK